MLSYTRFSSRVAQNALNFALVLLIVDETGKAFFSSLLVLALIIPSTIGGLAAGAAADIFPKRLLITLGDLGRGLVCLWFVFSSQGAVTYYFVAILLASFSQFATNAEGALMPLVVKREDLGRANAIGQAVGGAAQLVGLGVLTPVVLRLFHSPEALFIICAALFAMASIHAVAIGRVKGPSRVEVGGDRNGGPWWLVGWRQIGSDSAVMHATIELTVISSALVILAGLIPTFIGDVLHLPVDVGAVVLTPAVFGVVLGLRVAAFFSHRVPHAVLSTAGFTAFVVLLAMLTFVNQEADFLGGYGAFGWLNHVDIGSFDGGGLLAMLVMFPLGFSYAVVSVSAQTVLNDRVPLHLQGRVLATQAALAGLASSLPVLIAGGLTDLVGVTPVMAVLAAGIGVVAVLNLRQPPARRAAAAGMTT